MFLYLPRFARIKEAGNAFNTTKSTIGPVKYMAPESLRDKVPVLPLL